MKKLFITLFILFISFASSAQQQFEGTWVSKTSSYITTIIASEYAVLKVFNFSFIEDDYIEEKIIEKNKKTFRTKLYNPDNGYTVFIQYTMKDSELYCTFTGDLNETIKLTKTN